MGSNSDVSAFFRLRFRNGLGTKPAARPKHLFLEFGLVAWATFRHFSGCGFAMAWAQNLLGFCLFACASQTPFSWVWSGGLQASKSYVAQRFALLEATFFFVFSRFQKQRFALSLFGIFRRFHKQRFGSFLAAVSHGLGIYISFFLMGSNSDVSAFFRLRFRNGLGTKPAWIGWWCSKWLAHLHPLYNHLVNLF